MTNDWLSEKERAVLEAARREVAKRAAARPESRKAAAETPASTPLDQPTVLGWDHPAANPKRATGPVDQRTRVDGEHGATVPLDQPTVLGWDNPAAQQDAAAAKWEQVARLMAEEREAAEVERRKVKRYGLLVSAALFAAGMMIVLALWPRPGA